ncbi:hypothetical protein Ancab_010706 [Ancistrocladus abbreviatus]
MAESKPGKPNLSIQKLVPSPSPNPSSYAFDTPRLRIFSFAELKHATKNFGAATVLGHDAFGKVYKGCIDEENDDTIVPSKSPSTNTILVACNRLKAILPSCQSDQSKTTVVVKWCRIAERFWGFEQWQAEMCFLGMFTHPNLVKYLGYCWEDKELLHVYEYLPNRSLDYHLFNKGSSAPPAKKPLSWDIRINIALGAARGLAFLHNLDRPVIHRDFQASSILLDESYNPKISGFSLATFGPSNGNPCIVTKIVGTTGWGAPEYISTGCLYVKSDVYRFGIVLLEMVTGKRHMVNCQDVEWAKSRLSSDGRLKTIMDVRMEGQYPLNAAHEAVQLALRCSRSDPKTRPNMAEVVQVLQHIEANSSDQRQK